MPVRPALDNLTGTPPTCLGRRGRGHRSAVAGLLAVAVLAGCRLGPTSPPKTLYLESGQVPSSALPNGGSGHGGTGGSATTIPLAKQNPLTELFTALGVFQSCLKGLGVKFIGAPDQSNPNSPTNDPTYLKSLKTCAAQSNIIQALKDAQNSQNHLTPAQIDTQNKAYLKWRLCMIGRGWGIPMPKPDSNGRLFALGGSGGGGPAFTPPPGKTILDSGDMQACAEKVAPNATASGGGSGG